jgi:DNA-binding transcriptional ArsR family regulator
MTEGKTSGERSVGAESLKAFAHPLRMAMYEELTRAGSATASQLARTLGESSGQTSYHLRQLERHGFVEDDPSHSGGRERWWRPVGFRLTDEALLRDPATEDAVLAVVRQAIGERASALTAWLDEFGHGAREVVGQLTSSTLVLTDAESEQLLSELAELLERWGAMAKTREVPDAARRFRVHLDVFPLAPPKP